VRLWWNRSQSCENRSAIAREMGSDASPRPDYRDGRSRALKNCPLLCEMGLRAIKAAKMSESSGNGGNGGNGSNVRIKGFGCRGEESTRVAGG
jgi:hypothetical protein